MARPDPLPIIIEAAAALAAADQPGASFTAIERAAARAIGHRLFTIMQHDAAAGLNRRVYTSDPRRYPVAGFKPVVWEHAWARQVLVEGRPWIGGDAAAIAWAYPDHETILAMGLGSAMNLPVRWQGRTLGALNLLHRTGHFVPSDAAVGSVLAGLAVPALLGMVSE